MQSADTLTAMKFLAESEGISLNAVKAWKASNDLVPHHFQGNTIQWVPDPIHRGIGLVLHFRPFGSLVKVDRGFSHAASLIGSALFS